jgi:putative ABC transport system substrate-binding protein
MTRREFITLVGGAAAWSTAARAQQPAKVYRIGYLSPSPISPEFFAMQSEPLRQLGWIEGKNVIFERRYANNRLDLLAELAAELVRLNVDLIVAPGTLAPLALQRATSTIPIVMNSAGDPLGSGLVASLARPGGNVTGLSLMAPDLGGKRLELLIETLPQVSRVGILWNAANPYSALVFKETQNGGKQLRIQLQSIEVRSPDDFDSALSTAGQQRADALITVEDPLTLLHRKRIVDFAATNHLPAIYGLKEFTEAGGLMAYGANLADLYRRAAGYVDKILKGAKPADLPVEQSTKVEFVVNLRTAKALRLNIPLPLIGRADEVIE